ncbi:MAG: zinc-binding protein [Lautropia sp. SCN 69-89]|nr:MAG: zinc-binding protein [Lautropia sp. SCN 69-89]
MTTRSDLPLVYSCSGCSSAAQLANHLAVRLDRAGLAEMSCIAGIGGDVPALVGLARKAARAGRPILAIDGCALACALACLRQRGLAPTEHVQLADDGVRKSYHADFDAAQADLLYDRLVDRIAELRPISPAPSSVPDEPIRRTAQG